MREPSRNPSTVVAVVSGKGGTGKSVVAVNLAVTLNDAGHTVALVDADVGQGACSLLLGETADAGPVLVAADAGHDDPLAELDASLAVLADTMRFVIIDAPAGLGPGVRWALDRADAGLLVLVDEPTAVADAYALTKQVWSADPDYPIASVVNLADDEEEAAGVASRFAGLTDHFLGRKILYGGWVPFSAEIRRSVRRQQPAVHGSTRVRHAFEAIADRVRYGSYAPTLPMVMN